MTTDAANPNDAPDPNAPTGTDDPANTPDDTGTVSPDEFRKVTAALRKANKEAENARLELKKRQDAELNETEREKKAREDAESRAEKAEKALLRLTVASAKGLPAELAARLQGDTAEEMEADAEALAALVAARPPSTPGVPSGARQTAETADMNVFLRRAAGRA